MNELVEANQKLVICTSCRTVQGLIGAERCCVNSKLVYYKDYDELYQLQPKVKK